MTFTEGPPSAWNIDRQRSPRFLILYPKALPLAWDSKVPRRAGVLSIHNQTCSGPCNPQRLISFLGRQLCHVGQHLSLPGTCV